jgi:hypothetical protein
LLAAVTDAARKISVRNFKYVSWCKKAVGKAVAQPSPCRYRYGAFCGSTNARRKGSFCILPLIVMGMLRTFTKSAGRL